MNGREQAAEADMAGARLSPIREALRRLEGKCH
jgi:hypothetical protein